MRLSLLGILAVLFSLPAMLVAVDRAQAQATIHVPADQPTIQAGITVAKNGDTVLVAPGTYYENIDFKGKAITVTSSGGAAVTILDGANQAPAVTFANGESRSAVFSGFTVQHGGGGVGYNTEYDGQVTGGIFAANSAPTILNNVLQNNNCYSVLIEAASPLVQNNEITLTQANAGNACDYVAIGTGIFVEGALASASPSLYPTILRNTIEHNNDSEDASSSGGGGIHVFSGFTIIENNTIRYNYSTEAGGGIAVSQSVRGRRHQFRSEHQLLGLARGGGSRRSFAFRLLALLPLCFFAIGLSGCNGYYPPSTPPGTYMISVTATGTSQGSPVTNTHSLQVTLLVTP